MATSRRTDIETSSRRRVRRESSSDACFNAVGRLTGCKWEIGADRLAPGRHTMKSAKGRFGEIRSGRGSVYSKVRFCCHVMAG
jgi:hypothetical protein